MTKLLMLTVTGLMLLSGCAGFDASKFENRVACTVSKDKAFVVSEYGPVGVASTISDKDTSVICK